MTKKYKKAPKYEGKDLTLNIGRADKKILDGIEYTDSRMARFAPEFMVEVDEEAEARAAKAKEKARAKAKDASAEESEEYTEANLNKLNKGELISLALGEFELELDEVLKKAEMIAAILEKQGE